VSARRTPPSDEFAAAVRGARKLSDGKPRVKPARARASAPKPRASASSPRPDPFEHPDPDEPRVARRASLGDKTLARLRAGAIAAQRAVDLHGLRADAARERVRREIEAAAAAGRAVVRIVHGRGRRSGGIGVLRSELPEWLEAEARVLAYAPAPGSEAQSEGALVVLVRTGA